MKNILNSYAYNGYGMTYSTVKLATSNKVYYPYGVILNNGNNAQEELRKRTNIKLSILNHYNLGYLEIKSL